MSIKGYSFGLHGHFHSLIVEEKLEDNPEMASKIFAITFVVLCAALGLNATNVAVQCAKAQEGKLEALIASLVQRVEEIGEEFKGEIEADLGPIAAEVRGELESLANAIRESPKKVAQWLEQGKFIEAGKVVQATRDQATASIEAILIDLQEVREQAPEILEKTKELGQEFLQESDKGAEAIQAAIQQCIENGGPTKA